MEPADVTAEFAGGAIPDEPEAAPFLRWAVAARPKAGQTDCGDTFVVMETPYGAVIAAVDGLGHGRDAAAASQAAVAAIRRHASDPPELLLQHCHEALVHTRGAVATVAQISRQTDRLRWAGVGNVECVLARAAAGQKLEYAPLRGGVLGSVFPPVHVGQVALSAGDTLILATDGIGPDFPRRVSAARDPGALVRDLLASEGKDSDDALVLAVRYCGGP